MMLCNTLLTFLLFWVSTMAHMAIKDPCPRYNAHCIKSTQLPPNQQPDYSQTSSLGASEPLCKYTVPLLSPSAQWTAGQSITVVFDGSARHSGGHCQFSMSYDGGKTFVVIYEVLKYCLYDGMNGITLGNPVDSYTFTLPKDLPSSDSAVFAWTWVNAIGNREFYMNCADVTISGNSKSYSGKQMTILNHNGYPTVPEFDGGHTTGLNYYDSAPIITVTGNGQTAKSKIISSGAVTGDVSSSSSSSEQATYRNSGYNTAVFVEISTSGLTSHSASNTGGYSNTNSPSAGATAGGNTLVFTPNSNSPAASTPLIPVSSSAPYPANFKAFTVSTAGGQCSLGEMRCGSNTGTFDTCDYSGWVNRPCAPGTSCKMSSAGGSPCV